MADMTEWFKYRTVDSTTRVQFPLFAFSRNPTKQPTRKRSHFSFKRSFFSFKLSFLFFQATLEKTNERKIRKKK